MKENFYWNIPAVHRYDMSSSPKELDVGSLVDDWEFVSGLVSKNDEPVVYQLTEVAPLLNYIGEALAAKAASKGG